MKLHLSKEGNSNTFELISISRILQNEEDEEDLPPDEFGLLRVSPTALRHLASTYHIPSAFLAAVFRSLDVFGSVFRRQSKREWDYWCLLPCRVAHKTSADMARSPFEEQMDPFSNIYFENQEVGIMGHEVALYVKRDCETRRLRVFVVNKASQLLGGLKVQKPLAQIQNGLERRSSMDLDGSPCFVVLVYVAFILEWWSTVLLYVNRELIDHERMLQREIANETEGFLNASKVLNAALHAMAAHLYHYKTELQRLEMVLSDLRKHRTEMTYKPRLKRRDGEDRKQEEKNEEDQEEFPPIDRELQKIEQLASRLAVISSVSDEMEKKVQNILALLFNQIQAINDKTLQAILNASQQENRISQKLSLASHMLSRSMKRDSIAMKTIAIMTLVFLPGATFAAIFAMPFFTENKYLSSPSQVWIWIILTVICTAFAFGGYVHVVKRGESTLGGPEDDNDTTVSSAGTTASNAPSAVGNGENTSSNGNKQHWWQRVSQRASEGGIELRVRRGS